VDRPTDPRFDSVAAYSTLQALDPMLAYQERIAVAWSSPATWRSSWPAEGMGRGDLFRVGP